jgi:S1/P1 Nuclease
MFRQRLGIALLCLWLPAGAQAWGDEGHEIVALIADHYLKAEVRARIIALLATDQSGLTADRSMAAESTWADRYKELHRDTQDWHYVDIEIDASPSTHGQLLTRIEQFRTELSDPATSPRERLLALQFLLHLIGDLHQPLHAADDHDHGGNQKQVVAQGERRGNLHHYWDTLFVQRLGEDATPISQRLIAGITPDQRAGASRGTPASWAAESFDIARAEVYGQLPAGGPDGVRVLDEDYVHSATITVGHQLQLAGMRLAQVLNDALR